MTLHPIPSEFSYTVYEENFVFFLSMFLLGWNLKALHVSLRMSTGTKYFWKKVDN
jgi:hypothetical protein